MTFQFSILLNTTISDTHQPGIKAKIITDKDFSDRYSM